METINAIVPSGLWPDAKVTARRNIARKTVSRDLFLMLAPFNCDKR
jgi:hypothetical protein